MSNPYADRNGPKILPMFDPYADGKCQILPDVQSKQGMEMAGRQQCPIPNSYICPWLLSYHWANSATNFLLLIFDSTTMIFRQHSSLPRVLILMNRLMCIVGQGMSNDEDDEEDGVGSSEQLWHRFSFLSYIFMSDPLCRRKVVVNMSYRLCGRNAAQNSRLDLYADGTGKKSSIHKCQNLLILDQTLHSIRQGPCICQARGWVE